jgi:serine/threonine-protein kinase ATR
VDVQGEKMANLLDKVLDMFPPLLHGFFLTNFAEPASWHNARIAFTRTTAVWCMVGHMLGLGDRHGENILMDTVTGDCIHIDFACLFDKVGTFFRRHGSC